MGIIGLGIKTAMDALRDDKDDSLSPEIQRIVDKHVLIAVITLSHQLLEEGKEIEKELESDLFKRGDEFYYEFDTETQNYYNRLKEYAKNKGLL